MTEGPLSLLPLVSDYSCNARKNLFFITVKDNTQLTKYTKIGKINDWIRKKSDKYCIVRGMEGGIHFHILAVIPDNTTLKYVKGIHFHATDLTNARLPMYDPGTAYDDFQTAHLSDIFRENKRKYIQQDLTESQMNLLLIICNGIKKRILRLANKLKRSVAKTKKEKDLQRILNYMHKNLLEPRPQPLTRYVDYIIK